jgi:pimeloyl-ACP methyl ester carboxylesterase
MDRMMRMSWLLSIVALLPTWVFGAEDWSPATSPTATYGVELQGFEYPYPVKQFSFSSQRQMIHMTYMDVLPTRRNGRTAVLLHGKNYCAATWYKTMVTLAAAGYRAIAPDQIGFCKSTKPERYQYTFQQLARNTHALLISLGVTNATVIAHSTGGMIGATR